LGVAQQKAQKHITGKNWRTIFQKHSPREKYIHTNTKTSKNGTKAIYCGTTELHPILNIDIPEIDEHYTIFEKQAIICRFNYFWPKPVDIFHWIFTNWTTQCEIHLCSKGFFIVNFPSAEARNTILREGPWF